MSTVEDMPNDIIVYDIETQESFQQVGSRDPKKLHISVLGAYSYNEREFFSYTEEQLPQFWKRIEQCQMVVGFNNHSFDDQVLSTYFPEMAKVQSFDMLAEVQRALGFRLRLDNLAQASLGAAKSGDGLHDIALFAEGRIDELTSYCLDDVKITHELYEFGKNNGFVRYSDLKGLKQVAVDFNPPMDSLSAINLSLF